MATSPVGTRGLLPLDTMKATPCDYPRCEEDLLSECCYTCKEAHYCSTLHRAADHDRHRKDCVQRADRFCVMCGQNSISDLTTPCKICNSVYYCSVYCRTSDAGVHALLCGKEKPEQKWSELLERNDKLAIFFSPRGCGPQFKYIPANDEKPRHYPDLSATGRSDLALSGHAPMRYIVSNPSRLRDSGRLPADLEIMCARSYHDAAARGRFSPAALVRNQSLARTLEAAGFGVEAAAATPELGGILVRRRAPYCENYEDVTLADLRHVIDFFHFCIAELPVEASGCGTEKDIASDSKACYTLDEGNILNVSPSKTTRPTSIKIISDEAAISTGERFLPIKCEAYSEETSMLSAWCLEETNVPILEHIGLYLRIVKLPDETPNPSFNITVRNLAMTVRQKVPHMKNPATGVYTYADTCRNHPDACWACPRGAFEIRKLAGSGNEKAVDLTIDEVKAALYFINSVIYENWQVLRINSRDALRDRAAHEVSWDDFVSSMITREKYLEILEDVRSGLVAVTGCEERPIGAW
jgi:hypothetical protein